MPQVTNESSGSDEPDSEVSIRMTVPEELAGASMGEFQSRRGSITAMDVRSGVVIIRGAIPASEFRAFQHTIASATQQRGRVDRE